MFNHLSKHKLCLSAFLFCILSLSTLAAEITPLNVHITQSAARAYRLGSGDLLTLYVYPQSEYSAEQILVRPDGTASFPIVGQINIQGKTIDEAQKELEIQLNKTIRNYKLSLTVHKPRPAIFYLSGAVNKTGPLELITDSHEANPISQTNLYRRTEQSLINILANAGGIKLNADLSQIQVRNGETGDITTFNLWKVLQEADASQNPWLNYGDSIFIPALPQEQLMPDTQFKALMNSAIAPKNFPVRVIGQVQNPNLIHLEGESPLLSTAIAMAGGYTPQGLQKAVAIRRLTDEHHFSTLIVDASKNDFILRPNDIVYVGEAKAYKAGRYMDQIAHIVAPFEQAALTGGFSAQTFGFGGWRKVLPQGSTLK